MTITLDRQAVEAVRVNNRHLWPLRITSSTTEPEGDAAVFVYHRRARFDADAEDRFECIASVSQMDELPVDEPDMEPDPDTGEVTPYYRKTTLEFNCRSAAEADDLWARIKEDVLDLVNNLLSRGLLSATESAVISPNQVLQDWVDQGIGDDPLPQYATDDDLDQLNNELDDIHGGTP